MAAGCDEVQIASNADLGGMDVAEVVRAVDNPEFLSPVVKSRISSFSGRTISVEKRSFAFTRNDVVGAVLHNNTSRVRRGPRRDVTRHERSEKCCC